MITLQEHPRLVEVGHWHIEQSVWEGGVCVKQKIRTLRIDYIGLLHGFGVEGTSEDGMCICALVEKEDGTFNTPSVTVIRLISPTTRP